MVTSFLPSVPSGGQIGSNVVVVEVVGGVVEVVVNGSIVVVVVGSKQLNVIKVQDLARSSHCHSQSP